MESPIQYLVSAGVGVIRLNRPEVLNALNASALSELLDTVRRASADSNVHALIITGGTNAFCTGEDLREATVLSRSQFVSQITDFQRLATAIREAPKPVLAAIAGAAFGGGLEIAVNCDARIAAENAVFGCPEVKWGLTITNGTSVLLRRLIGDGWARELTLFGSVLDSAAARRIGLVTRLVPVNELEESAFEMARQAAEFSPEALRLTKGLLNMDSVAWKVVLEAEVAAVTDGFGSESVRQRLASFAARKDAGQGRATSCP